MAKLKVYMTTYNRAKYLRLAIESVLAQTFRDYELLVLDNCSTDNTRAIVDSFNDTRVSYFCQDKNVGGMENINFGFDWAETEYFCVLHDDDICHQSLFEEEIKYLEENTDCDAVSCLANNIDENGVLTRKAREKNISLKTFMGTEFFEYYINNQTSLIFPPTIYRSAFIKNHGIKLRHEPGPCGDVVLYMDIEREGGKIARLNRSLIDYRVYSGQDSMVHFEIMLIQLVLFLKKDEYYGGLLKKNKIGRYKYHRWFSKKLIIRTASEKIGVNEAKGYFLEMKSILDVPIYCSLHFIMVLKMEKMFPYLFKNIYKAVKNRQMQRING